MLRQGVPDCIKSCQQYAATKVGYRVRIVIRLTGMEGRGMLGGMKGRGILWV